MIWRSGAPLSPIRRNQPALSRKAETYKRPELQENYKMKQTKWFWTQTLRGPGRERMEANWPDLVGTVRIRRGQEGRPWEYIIRVAPRQWGGSVRVNTAATAANTATPPQRPPARRALPRAACPQPGPRRRHGDPWARGDQGRRTGGPQESGRQEPTRVRGELLHDAAAAAWAAGPHLSAPGAGVENAGSPGSQARAAVRVPGVYRITAKLPPAHHGTAFFNRGSLGCRRYGLPPLPGHLVGLTETGARSSSGPKEG